MFQALLNIDTISFNGYYAIRAAQHVVTDKSLREASCKAEQKFQAFSVEMSMKKEVYDNLVLFREKYGLDNLEPEVKRFVEKSLVDGKRSGK